MQIIRVSDLLIGKINNLSRILILTGKLNTQANVKDIFYHAVDLDGNEYNFKMQPIAASYYLAGGPFGEYKQNDLIFHEVFPNKKLMDIIKKEKYDEISLNEVKALDLLVKKIPNFNNNTNDKENIM